MEAEEQRSLRKKGIRVRMGEGLEIQPCGTLTFKTQAEEYASCLQLIFLLVN